MARYVTSIFSFSEIHKELIQVGLGKFLPYLYFWLLGILYVILFIIILFMTSRTRPNSLQDTF